MRRVLDICGFTLLAVILQSQCQTGLSAKAFLRLAHKADLSKDHIEKLAPTEFNMMMLERRQNVIQSIFGTSQIPQDAVPLEEKVVEVDALGFPLTRLVWDIGYGLNSTAYRTQAQAEHQSDSLVLWHNGHMPRTERDHMRMCAMLAEQGFDVLEFAMPLWSWNLPDSKSERGFGHNDHEQLAQIAAEGGHPISVFIAPIVKSVSWALGKGYKHVHMIGLSGGGWTTTVAAAVDPRIERSFEIAGSLPFQLRHMQWDKDHGDFEQDESQPMYEKCDMECLYVLGALEPGRHRVQMLHEKDDCCFAAEGRHQDIRNYEKKCSDATNGRVKVLITDTTAHTVSPFERRHLTEMLTEGGLLEF